MEGSLRIKTENLWHTYPGNVTALRGIDLEIRDGEFIGLIGQNGSGKTTLAKHFNRLLKPTKGRVLIDGVDAAEQSVSELSRKVGYLFQYPDHQIFCPKVRQEVEFGPKNMGWPEDEVAKAVAEALKIVGLEDKADTAPTILCLGERRKVTLASVLAMKPDILVLDEPTTGIDWADCLSIMDTVKELNAKGNTVIVITHDMRIIAENVRRVLVLAEGKVLLDDTTKNVFSQPDVLRKTFLSPPQITQLAQRLKELGMSPDVLTVQEFFDEFVSIIGDE